MTDTQKEYCLVRLTQDPILREARRCSNTNGPLATITHCGGNHG